MCRRRHRMRKMAKITVHCFKSDAKSCFFTRGRRRGRKREKANDDFHQQLPEGREGEGEELVSGTISAKSAKTADLSRGKSGRGLNVAKTISVRRFGWRISRSAFACNMADLRLKFMIRHGSDSPQTSVLLSHSDKIHSTKHCPS